MPLRYSFFIFGNTVGPRSSELVGTGPIVRIIESSDNGNRHLLLSVIYIAYEKKIP